MKFLHFFKKPHRIIAIFLGLSFLVFTQLVVFKPVETITIVTSNEIAMPVITPKMAIEEDSFDLEEIYYSDLIEALEEMSDDAATFAGLKNINIEIESLPKNLPKIAPRIAIVIDDIGMNREQSWNAVNFDFPVTLAFLPYAKNIQEMADKGKEQGHDIILHVPMQPLDDTVNAGENVLKIDLSDEEFKKALDTNLSALTSYVGINNHMGSAFTQDESGMRILMSYLKDKNVFYLDSRTTAESKAKDISGKYNVPFLERDVFLDHEETYEFTKEALNKLERIALENGQAIAIGHPKEITIRSLELWAKTLEVKGIELVTLSELVPN